MKNQVKERVLSKNKKILVKNLPSGSTKAASSLIDQKDQGFLSQGLIATKGKNSQNKNNSSKQKKK